MSIDGRSYLIEYYYHDESGYYTTEFYAEDQFEAIELFKGGYPRCEIQNIWMHLDMCGEEGGDNEIVITPEPDTHHTSFKTLADPMFDQFRKDEVVQDNNDTIQGATGAQYRFIDTSPRAQALDHALQQIMLGFSTLSTVISSLQQDINQIKINTSKGAGQ